MDSGVLRQRHRVAQPNPAVLDESFKRQRDASNGTMKHAAKERRGRQADRGPESAPARPCMARHGDQVIHGRIPKG